MAFKDILMNLPEVTKPTEKKVPFKEKLKWTGITLVLFFVLGLIPLYGLGENALSQFEILSLILASEFGSVISLGIGPIVTASILLQLLNGSGLLKFDMQSADGKKTFQAIQKLTALAFIVFEAIIYVALGGLSPQAGINPSIIVFQLILGGILILFMDEVISKWGFGSGISLFIAAGVSKQIMVRLISPMDSAGGLSFTSGQAPIGALLAILHFLPQGVFIEVVANVVAILATLAVFAMAVFAQSMKVEIPLSFGRIRGHGIRWPLNFIYTSNIPVILVAALIANIQLAAGILNNNGVTFLGSYSPGGGSTGLIAFVTPTTILTNLIRGSFIPMDFIHAITYTLFMMGGSVLFATFWVKTAGMDAASQAKQIMNSGLQIPGFRKDQRVLESLLNRYIPSLTFMGALTVGFLAAVADLMGALTSGTGLLLTVMIIYKLYEEIAQQHAMDMNPMLRRFME